MSKRALGERAIMATSLPGMGCGGRPRRADMCAEARRAARHLTCPSGSPTVPEQRPVLPGRAAPVRPAPHSGHGAHPLALGS